MLQSVSLSFDDLIQTAKEKSREKKLAGLDANVYLSLAQTNPKVQAELDWKIGEGVREQDFRRWWDMPDLERQLLVLMDFIGNAGYFGALRDKGFSAEEALRLVNQASPSYVEFSDMSKLPKNADFPLPIELRERVERRVEQERAKDPSGGQWTAYRNQFSSVNALVRHEIAAGRL